MPLEWGGKTFHSERDVQKMYGISPETLMRWRTLKSILTIRMAGETMYEEQSLLACIARHGRGRGR